MPDKNLEAYTPGTWTRMPAESGDYTLEERIFLRLLALYGPVIPANAASKLVWENEIRNLPVFRPARRVVDYVSTTSVAALLARGGGPSLPPAPAIDLARAFSLDANGEGRILWLGKEIPANDARRLSLFHVTLNHLHALYGPVVDTTVAARLLHYKSAAVLTMAMKKGLLPLNLATPARRHRSFLSTEAIAHHLAALAAAGVKS